MPVDIKHGSWRKRCMRCGHTSTAMTRGDVVFAPPANKCPRCGSHEMVRAIHMQCRAMQRVISLADLMTSMTRDSQPVQN